MRNPSLLLPLLLAPIFTFAQGSASLRGLLVDSEFNPVPFASVIVLMNDTIFVKGEVSKDDGTFMSRD